MVIAVTNRGLCRDDFAARAAEILRGEPFLMILREKDMDDEEYKALAADIIKRSGDFAGRLSLNRSDIAAELGVDNVHLTINGIREGRPDIRRVGVSVHSVEEAKEAQSLGADYLIAGHIYPTDCKKGVPARGIGFLRQVIGAVSVPVFAIGGINEDNFREPLECGAGICLMSEFMVCGEPCGRVRFFAGSL